MELITLGQSELQVSRLVFGAMAPRPGIDAGLRRKTLDAAIDAGMTAIDTAPLYDFGRCESWLGEALAGRRDRIQLLTKVGLRWDDTHGELLFRGPDPDGVPHDVRRDSRPGAVRRDVEDSLRRLRTDVLDLVQVHQLDADTPVAETMGELLRLRDEGKLHAIGVSNYPPRHVAQARAALGAVPLSCHQLCYNLLQQGAEREVLPQARAHGIGVLAYSPLCSGRLTRSSAGDSKLRTAQAELQAMAQRHDASAARLAVAWVLAQPGVSAAIVGASRPEQIADSAAAVDVKLGPDELAELRRVFAKVQLEEQRRGSLVRRAARRARGAAERLRRLF